jgi:predicted metal-dependent hydrolase
MKEEMLYRNLQRMRNASVIGVDFGSDVKMLEKMVEDARKEIADKAVLIILRFIDIANSLGLDRDDINGLAGIAGLLVYDKFTSYKKSINYLGLYKARGRDGRRNKKYSRKIQRYLIMLTNTILRKNGETRIPRYRDLRKVLKKIVDIKKSIGLARDGAGV